MARPMIASFLRRLALQSALVLLRADDPPTEVREAKLYGGQAVLEGVLMKSGHRAVVSVRHSPTYTQDAKGKWLDPTRELPEPVREAGEAAREIESKCLWESEGAESGSAGESKPKSWKQRPFLRGVFVLIESLSLGTKALEYSAEVAAKTMEGAEPKKESGWDKLLSVVLPIGLVVLLFIYLPTMGAEWLGNTLGLPAQKEITNPLSQAALLKNGFAGLIKIGIFLAYILIIRAAFIEIHRVFRYHGAEHKTVNAYEAAVPLTVESVQRMTTFHRRCGTSFIFLVALVDILLASLTGWPSPLWRVLRGVLLLIPVAAISYELLRLTAAHPAALWSRILATPGRWFQKITALEPSDNMVQVAVTAFTQVMGEATIQAVPTPRVELAAAE